MQNKTTIEIKTRVDGEHTYVLCRSEQRIAKDRAIRTKQEGRLRAYLKKSGERLMAERKLVKVEKMNQVMERLKEGAIPASCVTLKSPPTI